MQINADQLARHLERGLAPAYVVSGDEPLLIVECCALIRARAVADGYERSLYTAGPGFDWDQLRTASQSLSLFAERRLFELRLPTGRPGDAGAELLADYGRTPPADTVLLVVTGKLDKAQRESAWMHALESDGVAVTVWPLAAERFPAWLGQRLKARGLAVEPGVVELLAWHLEGNLLAAAQEVDKLAMLVGGGTVARADVEASLADSARFSIYALVDAALGGDAQAVERMLPSLRAEGTEPILVQWALARELRALSVLAIELARGKPEAGVLARVWQNRRPIVAAALRRHRARVWLGFLREAARLDRVLKGRARGDLWLELERLLLAVSGQAAFALRAEFSEINS